MLQLFIERISYRRTFTYSVLYIFLLDSFHCWHTFKVRSGWLKTWKNRYGVRQVNPSEKKLSADVYAVDAFKTEMDEFLQNYTRDQVFNANKMLPKNLVLLKTKIVHRDIKWISKKWWICFVSTLLEVMKQAYGGRTI